MFVAFAHLLVFVLNISFFHHPEIPVRAQPVEYKWFQNHCQTGSAALGSKLDTATCIITVKATPQSINIALNKIWWCVMRVIPHPSIADIDLSL